MYERYSIMQNILDSDTKFNKIYTFIGNTITVVSGIVSIASWVVKKLFVYFKWTPQPLFHYLQYIVNVSKILFIVCLLFLLFRMIEIAILAKSQSLYLQMKLAKLIHINLIHEIRNNIVELKFTSEKAKKFIKDNNYEAISECYNSELRRLKDTLNNYVDSLANYLSSYRNSTISVCIKVLNSGNDLYSNQLFTLSRSSNTKESRTNSKNTTIQENTDFANLYKGETVFFGCSNLLKLKSSGQYINDSPNWKQNKYISTLVTPIRYYNKNQKSTVNNTIKADIIGFLCIDSMDEIKEWENEDSFELQIMAIYSDILYVYIKEFYACFPNIVKFV